MRDVIRIDEYVSNGNEIEFQVPPLERIQLRQFYILAYRTTLSRIDLADCTLCGHTKVKRMYPKSFTK